MCLIAAAATLAGASQQPVAPNFYSGRVTIQGQPAPEGLSLVACVVSCEQPGWESNPVTTGTGGKYIALTIAPGAELVGKEVTFWLVNSEGRIKATETATYLNAIQTITLDLKFTDPLPMPEPTLTPTTAPTPTPSPTALSPIPGDSNVARIPPVAVILGAVALVGGIAVLWVTRRRRAF